MKNAIVCAQLWHAIAWSGHCSCTHYHNNLYPICLFREKFTNQTMQKLHTIHFIALLLCRWQQHIYTYVAGTLRVLTGVANIEYMWYYPMLTRHGEGGLYCEVHVIWECWSHLYALCERSINGVPKACIHVREVHVNVLLIICHVHSMQTFI